MKRVLAIVIGALLLASPALGAAAPPASSTPSRAAKTTKPTSAASTTERVPSPSSTSAPESNGVKWTDKAQAISAVAVMMFTAFLAWLSWRQHKLEQRLARDTAESIAIAKQSADAATSLALTTREAAEKQLRAYVRPELTAFNILGHAPAGDQPGVIVQFIAQLLNSGNTPGLELVAGAWVKVVPWPGTEEVAEPGSLSSFVAVASQSATTATFTQIIRFDRAAVNAGTWCPYVRIKLEYEDVFGRRWVSDFHWVVRNLSELLDAMERDFKGTMQSQAEMITDRCAAT